jgi:hypothetical protein
MEKIAAIFLGQRAGSNFIIINPTPDVWKRCAISPGSQTATQSSIPAEFFSFLAIVQGRCPKNLFEIRMLHRHNLRSL